MSAAQQIAARLLEDGEDFDPKEFAMGALPRAPRTWGDLKPGDVLYNHVTKAVAVIVDKLPRHGVFAGGDLAAFGSDLRPVQMRRARGRVLAAYYRPQNRDRNYVFYSAMQPENPFAPFFYAGRIEKLGDPWELADKLDAEGK